MDKPNYERIWLVPFTGDDGGHTWCVDRIGDDSIEYVRVEPGAVSLNADDAKTIKDMMEEFYLRGEMSPEESRAFLTLCTRGGFGRPVLPQGSGGGNA
jgi:hypothetical protein